MKFEAKRKISIVDFIIIIALAASLIAFGIGVFKGLGSSENKVSITYVIEAEPMDTSLCTKAKEGDAILDFTSGERIGTVSAASASQAYHKGIDSQGAAISSPMDGQSVLYITVKTEAIKTDTGYAVGGTVLGVGKALEVRLPSLYFVGKCASIEIID